ncbi:MAG: AgmX/PglI C-terminal domain-containing protein [Woeseiaceae bacterium]|nr:AgmX/PglI C-terminal domain-containing protein [Woeseiaceae bacterium]
MDDVQRNGRDFADKQRALREEIERSGQALEALESELRSIEQDLRALAESGPKYESLARVCQSLNELDDVGASDLFWGADASGYGSRDECIARARQRIDEFESELHRLQGERAAVAEKIGRQNLVLEHLDYSLADALEAEEARQAEWLIERDESDSPFRRRVVMPWARGHEEDDRFRRSLLASALVALVIGFAIPFIDLPIPEREQLIEVPERVAKLVEMNRPRPADVPAPVVEEPEPEPDPEPEPEPEPVLAEEVVPELSEEPAAQVAEVPQPASTKEQVKTKGILAFRDSFASRADNRSQPRLGSQAALSSAGSEAVGRPTRSMVTTNAPGSSGGINLSDISRDVGGGGGGGSLAGVQVTQVASSIGGSGSADRPLAGGPSAGRTDEEIQIVFDRYKAALYRLYNRELRKDPTLRGQIVLKLTIEPDGSVSYCTLESTDMNAPLLAEQIVNRVSGFDFGAKEDILAVTIVYPIDFLPAA